MEVTNWTFFPLASDLIRRRKQNSLPYFILAMVIFLVLPVYYSIMTIIIKQ